MIDFFPLFKAILSSFWYLFPFVILAGIISSSWFKGRMGEFEVNLCAKLFLNKKYYHLIHDVTLPVPNGTTQIDHLIVSRYGVFVVETKNYSGWIFGGQHQKVWTQQIYKSRHKFQNPIHQNYRHVKALEELLDIPPESIFSVVVFTGDTTFKTEMPENVKLSGSYITYIKSKKEIRLSEADVLRIRHAIKSARLEPSLSTNRQHVQNLKAVHLAPVDGMTPNCPRCGNEMQLRTARQGQNAGNKFWGCSKYPKCKGIINL